MIKKKKIIRKCQNPLCLEYDKELERNVHTCPECFKPTEEFTVSKQWNIKAVVLAAFMAVIAIGMITVMTTSIFKPGRSTVAAADSQNSNQGNSSAASSEPSKPLAEPEIILKIHGSNTIGSKFAPSLAEEFFKKKGAVSVKTVSRAADEMLVIASLPNNDKPQAIEVAAHGSSTAFQDLEKGACDIGAASRRINSDELDKLNKAGLGDMSLSTSEYILSLDGIAIIVNSANSIDKLTKEQVSQIFTGQLNDWSQLGGSAGEIKVYARDDKSGTYDTFKTLVLGNGKLVSDAKRYEDSTKLSEDVAGDLNGIGFIGLPYINNSKALAIAESGATNAILPTRFSVATEAYPLTRRLYFYCSTQNKNAEAREFIQFSLSEQGQKIAADTGFICQNIEVDTSKAISQVQWQDNQKRNDYMTLINSSQGRLSLDFRFKTGSASLDNKAIYDLDRVVQYLEENKNSKLLLFGFSDNIGAYGDNVKLSEGRASTVKDQLVARDPQLAARITAVGFGPEQPVASNDTDTNKDKNRRVEIWLTK